MSNEALPAMVVNIEYWFWQYWTKSSLSVIRFCKLKEVIDDNHSTIVNHEKLSRYGGSKVIY